MIRIISAHDEYRKEMQLCEQGHHQHLFPISGSFLDGIRQEANKLDVPYQSLMKVWLTEKLRETTARLWSG
jgi:hypothetical protein